MFEIEINMPKSKKDDYYLQWEHIYSWQMKLNIILMVKEAMERMNHE